MASFMQVTKTRLLLPSTIQLLRFPFSFFLMPVYWFALSQVAEVDILHALLVFMILHVLVYPASNGYNSYMDRDTQSIGGVRRPLQPSPQLLYATVLMDGLAVILICFISPYFVCFFLPKGTARYTRLPLLLRKRSIRPIWLYPVLLHHQRPAWL